MKCPICNEKTVAKLPIHDPINFITYRRIVCNNCGCRFWSEEHLVSRDNEKLKNAFREKEAKYLLKKWGFKNEKLDKS